MHNRSRFENSSSNGGGGFGPNGGVRPGLRPMQRPGGPGVAPSRPTSIYTQQSNNRMSSPNTTTTTGRPGPEPTRSVSYNQPRNPVRSPPTPAGGGVPPSQQYRTGNSYSPSQPPLSSSPIRSSPIKNTQPTATAMHRELGDNYVWVRTELVQAIWNNHGKLPPGWKPSRKRGRDIPSWGWMRAQILQSSSSATGGAIGQHRLRGSSTKGKSILATMKIDDDLFAPEELQNATVSFSYESGDTETVCPANTWWKQPNPTAPTDLCSLTHLHEPSVVFCLQKRYEQDIIYTYTGKILLALNPFRVVEGVYGDQVMKQYWQPMSLERPKPHAYAIAQDAYKSLLDMKEDQSVLVSGESGSGKTVTTKIIMGYLATQSRRVQAIQQNHPKVGVESQILQSNPILESFGNARTVRNDNSSRFGKYMELLFSPSGTLLSASIQTYLLEKVRLITQAPGERNYHVFYELLAGVSQKDRQLLKIANVTARDFRMTAASGTFDRRDGVDDRETYQDLRMALDTVGFSVDEQSAMLSVVCALLHTSNIDFQPAGADGSALVRSTSLRNALELLGVPMEALNNALCLCAIEARGEIFHKNMSVTQAEKALEALIKAAYGALFTYIVQAINKSITGEDTVNFAVESLPRIGVLDIFGFESFDFNSFEQLCINYCNEALQQQFNRFVFKLEQEEYKEEGIDWSFIDFPDNQDILDLIEKKRVGILSILDENCRLNSQTDSLFVRAVYDKCSKHPRFLGTNTQKANLQFSINHYAGVVTYDCIIFLEKNKDELPKETTELLASSSVPFLAHLGELLTRDSSSSAGNDRTAQASPGKNLPSYAQRRAELSPKGTKRSASSMIRESVGGQFRNQLSELRDRIDSTTPHYVRCLKPNDQLVPHLFEAHVIADQLRCAGVLEAIRVARVGFPHRFLHDQFLERYSILGKSKLSGFGRTPPGQRCVALVKLLHPMVLSVLREGGGRDSLDLRDVVSLGMQIGHSKVFLRRRVFEALEYLRTRQLGLSAIVIQKHARRYNAQMRYVQVYIATLTIQCFARRINSYRQYNMMLEAKAATKIQAQWRRFLAETELIAARLIAHFCQSFIRGALARRLFSIMRVEKQALLIQTCWRRHRHSSVFYDLRRATLVLQCFWRQQTAIHITRERRREARDLGAVAEERDRFKEESLQLREEVERLRASRGSGARQAVPEEDEVARLRREVEMLQMALSAQGTPPVADVPATPHSTNSRGRQGWFFGRGGDNGSVISNISIPGIKRVFSRSETNNHSESPTKSSNQSFSQDATSLGMSSNVSLLDAIGDNEVADYQLRSVADNSSASSPQIHRMPTSIAATHGNLFPLSERRGFEFCTELQRLHDSIRNNDIRTIERMLATSEEPHVLVNEADEKGQTALHTAVIVENMKAARIVIEYGAFVNAQDNLGQTSLHLAFGAPMTSLLLELGNANPNIPNMDGLCALHLAVQRFDVGSVRYLLQKNAKIDTADNIRWLTPLHISALPDGTKDEAKSKARRMIVDLLCNASEQKSDMNDQDNEGNTPLHYAVQIDTEEACHVISTFLQNGSDPRISNSRNQQPLLLLCHNNALRRYNEFQECLHAMLYHGADPNQTSDTGCTPLHLSLFHKDIDSAVQLINRAAELHLLWRKPKRWVSFWDDMGSSEVLPLDMVQDENTLYRVLAAITHPPKWAPTRTWCMSCKTPLGSFARAIHCRHCGRHVCGACTRCTLAPEFFPKTFDIYEASWVCFVCEKILVARREDNSTGTQPISSVGDEEERFYPSALDI